MPIFEFVCLTCGHPFEELVFNADGSARVTCPDCKSTEVKKQISMFASRISGGVSSSFNAGLSADCSPGGF